jgi:subtilisin family serine protease
VAPAQLAYQLGLMPLASTGVTEWRRQHPDRDGRGVLIAILDGGVDPGVPGLRLTPTGERKILDLRDFSDEGLVALAPVTVTDGRIAIGAVALLGAAAVLAAAAGPEPWYGGILEELRFGTMPAADLNGDGDDRDRFGVIVARSAAGWVAFVDTNGDGTLADERPVADYLVRGETFTFASRWARRGEGPVTAAVNLTEENGRPRLVVYFDNSGHGTHVAGIAAGAGIFGISGFTGVAPGAQLLGLKIADNSRGGVTTTGSMLRAMAYAVRFARERGLPLVMNMSFGIGNARPGRAVMDSIINAFLLEHPDIFFTIAAGNDGPGTATTGLPGSAALAVSVGATYPGSLAAVQFGTPDETMGWWSSRGGPLAKPDVVVPGLAYSTVPRWDTGGEVKGGTSMAAPHAAGLAAVLLGAALREGHRPTAAQLLDALRAAAQPLPGAAVVDQGAGMPRLQAAWERLRAGAEVPRLRVTVLGPAVQVPPGLRRAAGQGTAIAVPIAGQSGAFLPRGVSPADTAARFRVSVVPDSGVARVARTYRLASDATWLRTAAPSVTMDAATGSAMVEVRLDPAALRSPGRYAAAVHGVGTTDSLGPPAFVLPVTVIVPDTASAGVAARGRALQGGRADRYYVTVPEGALGLDLTLTVRDTAMKATLFLFEPTHRPARGERSADAGGKAGARARLTVGADDVRPGTWEVVVQAMPGRVLVYDLTAAVPGVSVLAADSAGALVVRAASGRDSVRAVAVEQLGVECAWEVGLPASVPWRRTIRAPAWARRVIVEADLDSESWDLVTDLAITLYDSLGAQLGNGAMNYPFHRVTADLPGRRPDGFPVVVELFPGFADPAARDGTPVRVRARFEGEPRLVARADAARGVAEAVVAAAAPLVGPDDARQVLRWRVATATDSSAVVRRIIRP